MKEKILAIISVNLPAIRQAGLRLNNVYRALKDSSQGVALIIVLWIVVILSAIGMEFSYSMRIETDLNRNFSDRQRAYFGARAGIERAVKEIVRYHEAMKIIKDMEEEPIWNLRGKPNHFSIGDMEITVRIDPENARININSLSKESLKEIFLGMGLKEEKADSVINCFLDWQDGDNLHRMMGAEKEYYQELNPSYQPANTAIEVIEELLMIKGIDKRLFYGKEALPTVADFVSEDDEETKSGIGEGLSSIFTVYSGKQIGKISKNPNVFIGPFRSILSSKVDLNSAPRAVLMSLPLMDEELVHAIIDARKEKPIKTEADLVELIGLSSYKGIQKYITLRQRPSRYYTLASTAFSGEEGISHSILAVVDIMPKRRMKNMPFTFIRWEDWKI